VALILSIGLSAAREDFYTVDSIAFRCLQTIQRVRLRNTPLMSPIINLQLARRLDAEPIAKMSRDLIEAGLGWSWTPARVAAQIRCRTTIVVVARCGVDMAGFGIMQLTRETAHLNLFAVAAARQRLGVGRRLFRWLEEAALIAGVATIQLEVRASNRAGRSFYTSLGFEEVLRLPGYYRRRETAVRMARFLRMSDDLAALFTQGRDFASGRV
jgi:[ribosomal protein S18]-alanine N-acetyltransferase